MQDITHRKNMDSVEVFDLSLCYEGGKSYIYVNTKSCNPDNPEYKKYIGNSLLQAAGYYIDTDQKKRIKAQEIIRNWPPDAREQLENLYGVKCGDQSRQNATPGKQDCIC